MARENDSVIRAGLIAFICALVVLFIVILINIVGLVEANPRTSRQQTQLWRGVDAANAIDLPSALISAQQRSKTWSSDVELIRIDASWRPTRDEQKQTDPAVSWSFYFYSPDKAALASVHVTGSQVFWVPPIQLTYAPEAIPGLPPFGVDVAWLTFRAAGGDDFLLRHKDAMINFHLHNKDDALVWTVTAFDDRGKHDVVVDANTGVLKSSGNLD
ncbi:MAG: PepSY domain-containing protein [Anaerolineae bacterium]|nr:PepSY domain-containing protein [Anaerolineae bacterium]